MIEFQAFPKMARLTRECVITEKIDGTNAQVCIAQRCSCEPQSGTACSDCPNPRLVVAERDGLVMFAGSRTRWITPEADNFGFATWVQDHADALFALGVGRHYGEWWGSGIQRGYGLQKGEKRFSLFNTSRWVEQAQWTAHGLRGPLGEKQEYAPECCHVVPVLYQGLFGPKHADNFIEKLKAEGSMAAPGFMNPEGVVVYHIAASVGFKKTIEKDEQPKSRREMSE